MSTSKITDSPLGDLLENSRIDRKTVIGLLFALPYLSIFAMFLLYPLVKGLYMSLFEWNAIYPSESQFIGIENYAQMFADPYFWNALGNTLYFTLLTVPGMVVLSLALALGINRNVKGKMILRTIFFSPYILTVSVIALVWMQLFEPAYGFINVVLGSVMASPPDWLQSRTFAMPALSIATLWWTVGFSFIVLLSARQNVPEYLYEAAKLDGARSWRAFKDVTIPQMRHALFFVVVINTIWSFQVFGQPYIMTGGGPGSATETLVMYIYQAAFNQRSFGYAAAVGYVLTAILVLVSIANYYILGGSNE